MAVDFIVEDEIHKIMAKYVNAFLPDAKKPYNLKAVFQPELDIHGIASKAEVYNIATNPRVIEEGLTAACKLIYYLAADGYKIKTPVFNLSIRLPGEYEGAETSLPEGVHPEARLQASAALRAYIRDHVQVEFDGIDQRDGLIAEALDEKTGQLDEIATIGNLVTLRGYGLKIEADADHAAQAGLFFDDGKSAPIKADIIAVNEPRTIKAIVPSALTVGKDYTLLISTMSSIKNSSALLKNIREVKSEFKLTAQT
ncbi:MAG: DUF4469 domain-containing protein [Treponema sp.]|jgi:hypothetical protein|nr:DUF4469 domain-containing protein [Treponema sp.]